jgi:hypothetical protein
LEATNDGVQGAEFPWVGQLLSKVHSKLLQDYKASYWFVKEGKTSMSGVMLVMKRSNF